MANPNRRLAGNAIGDFYVDGTCINCDTCRQLSPDVFEEEDGYSVVILQPETSEQVQTAMQALISCPSGSIGTNENYDKRIARKEFPINLNENVYYCGFNSPKSFGANSYFVRHRKGNWLIDSPRYTPYLLKKFQEMGGIKYIFLTHKDDVADAEKYAAKFHNCERIIHFWDRSAQTNAEVFIKGQDQIAVNEDFIIIPTSGHTKGHQVLLYDNTFLFTGDHLYWRRDWNALRASRNYCWYSWPKQVNSMEKLLEYSFNWILPGHGQQINLSHKQMQEEMEILVTKMRKSDYW